MDNSKRPAQPAPFFLAGHIALDFLNTQMRRNGQFFDFLQSDEDVLSWLGKAGFPSAAGVASQFERGHRGDAATLNGFLTDAESHLQLVWNRQRLLTIEKLRRKESPAAILGLLRNLPRSASHGRF
jgi:Putative stress-induced transcription regulator